MKYFLCICLSLLILLVAPNLARASVVTWNFTSTAGYVGFTGAIFNGVCFGQYEQIPADLCDPFVEEGATADGFVSYNTETAELVDCDLGFPGSSQRNITDCSNIRTFGSPIDDFGIEYSEQNSSLRIYGGRTLVLYETFYIDPAGGSYTYVDDYESPSAFAEIFITDVMVGPLPGCEPSGNQPPRCGRPTPNVIPLPASLPLLLAGVVGLGFLRKRQRLE